jgi:hypothetical protein
MLVIYKRCGILIIYLVKIEAKEGRTPLMAHNDLTFFTKEPERDWSPEHEKMGKGITLNADEVQELYKLLSKIVEG